MMTSSVATPKKKIVGPLFRKMLLHNKSLDYDLSLCNINESNRVVYISASLYLDTIRKAAYSAVRSRNV